MNKPQSQSKPTLARVPIDVAAELANVPMETIERWIASGRFAYERIKHLRYVQLDRVLGLAAEERGER